jgi:MacB-like periplasmic core domain
LIEGRGFDQSDGAGAPPTAIINQTMAKTFWLGQSAIGRRIGAGSGTVMQTVIGVVADVKNGGLDKPPGTELFLPYQQNTVRSGYTILRTSGDPLRLVPATRAEIARVDPSLPVSQVRTMEDVVPASQSRPRFLTLLLSVFSAVALILAAFGIYGLISYSVEQRVNEFGLRMALGAPPTTILDMVVRQGLLLGALGTAIGAAGALSLTRFMQTLLFDVDPLDLATFAMMGAVLFVITLVACYPKSGSWTAHIRAEVFAKKGHVVGQVCGNNSPRG